VSAFPFDSATLTVKGPSIPIANSVEKAANGGGVYFVVSNGLLLYATTRDRHQLVWVDRNGVATPITSDRVAFRNPRVSPDGTRIAVAVNDETRRSDIWIYDAQRGTKRRLTSDRHNLAPVWAPDGQRITFGDGRLVTMPADGNGGREILVDTPALRAALPAGTNAYPRSWSPDGAELLFHADLRQLWVFRRGAQPAIRPLLDGSFNTHEPSFSPDGKWLAYVSDESGRDEVYVRHYPDLGSPVAISTAGGDFPRWSANGREIFYRQGDALMAASVTVTPRFSASTPQRLFAGQYAGAAHDAGFAVAADGQRFVMVKGDDAAALNQLTVVQNWLEEVARAAAPSTR
jgi:serine/threonine-protein kinase